MTDRSSTHPGPPPRGPTVAPEVGEGERVAARLGSPRAGLRVLLVEDSDDDADLIVRALRADGLAPYVTRVDREAAYLDGLAAGPDVVISDLLLPGFSGRRALELRRRHAPDIPFILVSGAVDDESASALVRDGVTDYLLKDRLGRLGSAVLRGVDRRRALAAQQAAERAQRDTVRRWETLVHGSTDVIAVLDDRGRLLFANQALVRLLHHDLADVLGQPIFDYVHPDDVDEAARAFAQTLDHEGLAVPIAVRLRTAGGEWRYLEAAGNNRLHDPTIAGVVVNARDITDRVVAQQLLLDETGMLERIAADEDTSTLLRDIAAMAALGADRCEIGFRLWHPDFEIDLRPRLDDAEAQQLPITLDGVEVGAMVVAWPARHGPEALDPARVDGACHLTAMLLQREAAKARLLHQALHDPVTGLGNRVWFVTHCGAVPPGQVGTTVLTIDVDRFRLINDGLGHDIGDAVLRTLASRISEALEPGEVLARFGGDEFGVLVRPSTSRATQLAARLLDVGRAPIVVDRHELRITVSIGVAPSGPGDSVEDLLSASGAALGLAKQAGGNTVVHSGESEARRIRDRLQLEEDLVGGIPRGELECHLQPIVVAASGRVVGAEALVRWRHPTRGLLTPDAFLPWAEQTQLVELIDGWMLDSVCAAVARSPVLGGLTLSVNMSAREVIHPGMAGRVLETLDRHGVEHSAIAIEVTESAILSDLQVAQSNLSALRDGGVAVHIDDFGTGHSALSYVRELPMDALKIDRSFVQVAAGDRRAAAVIAAITTMAAALDLSTIAEGVETQAQRDTVAGLGVELLQGYFFARPCPLPEFEHWVRGRRADGDPGVPDVR